MIELPVCRWRGEPTIEDHHRCSSAKLTHGPNGVEDKLCFHCFLRDHPRPPRFQRLRRSIPRWLETVRNRLRIYLRFSKAVFWHTLAGLPHATAEEQAKRRDQCSRCPQFAREKDECKECGCKIGAAEKKGTKKLMRKTLWAGAQCPLWQATGPRSACQPIPPEGGWGPVKGVSLWKRLVARLRVLFK